MTIDFVILDFIQKIHQPILTSILKFITIIGNKGMIWFILIAILFLLGKKKLSCSMFGGIAIMQVTGNMIIKNILKRPRPFLINTGIDLLIKAPSSYSFPSGHAASSFACSTVIFLYNKKWGILAYIFSTIMGFSRIYFYVHYPTDVLAGAILGVICGILGTILVKWGYENIVPKIPFLETILKED